MLTKVVNVTGRLFLLHLHLLSECRIHKTEWWILLTEQTLCEIIWLLYWRSATELLEWRWYCECVCVCCPHKVCLITVHSCYINEWVIWFVNGNKIENKNSPNLPLLKRDGWCKFVEKSLKKLIFWFLVMLFFVHYQGSIRDALTWSS